MNPRAFYVYAVDNKYVVANTPGQAIDCVNPNLTSKCEVSLCHPDGCYFIMKNIDIDRAHSLLTTVYAQRKADSLRFTFENGRILARIPIYEEAFHQFHNKELPFVLEEN